MEITIEIYESATWQSDPFSYCRGLTYLPCSKAFTVRSHHFVLPSLFVAYLLKAPRSAGDSQIRTPSAGQHPTVNLGVVLRANSIMNVSCFLIEWSQGYEFIVNEY
jgi:hypothetical protein